MPAWSLKTSLPALSPLLTTHQNTLGKNFLPPHHWSLTTLSFQFLTPLLSPYLVPLQSLVSAAYCHWLLMFNKALSISNIMKRKISNTKAKINHGNRSVGARFFRFSTWICFTEARRLPRCCCFSFPLELVPANNLLPKREEEHWGGCQPESPQHPPEQHQSTVLPPRSSWGTHTDTAPTPQQPKSCLTTSND